MIRSRARACARRANRCIDGRDLVVRGFRGAQFRGEKRDCVPCPHRARCLRTPDRTQTRQVMFFAGRASTVSETYTHRMQQRLDTPAGRAAHGRRFATVEPVFANLRHNKGLGRFTLRGRAKVDGQWKRFCLVHNIGYADYRPRRAVTPPLPSTNASQWTSSSRSGRAVARHERAAYTALPTSSTRLSSPACVGWRSQP